jgi:formylglycine-generating enzyme required for sulfatase activity
LSLAGYRLPTEAELEFAARGGSVSSRYYGETADLLSSYAWYSRNSEEKTHPIGLLKPNEFGLFDAIGNAYGWCQDIYEGHYSVGKDGAPVADVEPPAPTIDPKIHRVLRGGSFNDEASYIRAAYRHTDDPDYRSSYLGFRVARTIGGE